MAGRAGSFVCNVGVVVDFDEMVGREWADHGRRDVGTGGDDHVVDRCAFDWMGWVVAGIDGARSAAGAALGGIVGSIGTVDSAYFRVRAAGVVVRRTALDERSRERAGADHDFGERDQFWN